MKKSVLLLSLLVLTFVSCEGPAGRDGFDGLDGAETYWFVRNYPITRWELINGEDQLNSYFRSTINIPELDRDIFENGHVLCYMYLDANHQTLLPYTLHKGKNDGNTELLWTETYSYEFSLRTITFYLEYSDFYTSNPPPSSITFRVVLNY